VSSPKPHLPPPPLPSWTGVLRDLVPIFAIPLAIIAVLLIWRPWRGAFRTASRPVMVVTAGLPTPQRPVPTRATPSPQTDTLGVLELLALRDGLRQDRHEELTEKLRLLLGQTARDIRAEQRLGAAWGAFELPELRPALERWVQAQPDSALPRLIRADVLTSLAYSRRGEKVAAKTKGKQFAAMAATFDSAMADLRLGLERDPSALPGYWTLIRIAQGVGGQGQVAAAGAAALEVAPASFLTRSRMMTALLPRWGGSYERMRQLAEDAQAHADSNPLLRSLLGFVDMDRADLALNDGDTTAALDLGEESLSDGSTYRLCVARARMLLNARRVAEGLEAAQCAKNHLPTSAEARMLLSYALNSTGAQRWPKDWERLFGLAVAEARVAMQLDPDDDEVVALWKFIRENSRKTLGHEP